MERRLLGHHPAAGGAVVAAGGREDEARHAGFLCGGGDADRAAVIDVVRQLGVEVAERVVRERREMDDRVESLEIAPPDVADVLPDVPDPRERVAEGAGLVEVTVEAGHLVPGVLEEGDEDAADVALVSGDQDLHDHSSAL